MRILLTTLAFVSTCVLQAYSLQLRWTDPVHGRCMARMTSYCFRRFTGTLKQANEVVTIQWFDGVVRPLIILIYAAFANVGHLPHKPPYAVAVYQYPEILLASE